MQLRPYQEIYIKSVRKAFIDGFKSPCVVAPCGAGKSRIISNIIKTAALKKNHVLFLIHRKEILDQVRNTLMEDEVDLNYVELGMVQTIVKRLERTKKPKMIVIDESHHILSKSYRNIIDFFSGSLIVSFTATPVRLNGSGLGDVNDILIEEVNAEWLIENGFLSPYKYYALS